MSFLRVLRERFRADDTARGAGDRQIDRDLRRRPQRNLAAVRLDHHYMRPVAVLVEPRADALDLTLEKRLDIGVGDGRCGAGIFLPAWQHVI